MKKLEIRLPLRIRIRLKLHLEPILNEIHAAEFIIHGRVYVFRCCCTSALLQKITNWLLKLRKQLTSFCYQCASSSFTPVYYLHCFVVVGSYISSETGHVYILVSIFPGVYVYIRIDLWAVLVSLPFLEPGLPRAAIPADLSGE